MYLNNNNGVNLPGNQIFCGLASSRKVKRLLKDTCKFIILIDSLWTTFSLWFTGVFSKVYLFQYFRQKSLSLPVFQSLFRFFFFKKRKMDPLKSFKYQKHHQKGSKVRMSLSRLCFYEACSVYNSQAVFLARWTEWFFKGLDLTSSTEVNSKDSTQLSATLTEPGG